MAQTIAISVEQVSGGYKAPISTLSATNFTVRLSSATGTSVPFAYFSNEGNSNYVIGQLTIPASTTAQGALVNVAINGTLRPELGTFRVYNDDDEPYTATKVESSFMSSTGDTVTGIYNLSGSTISLSAYIDQYSPMYLNDAPTNTAYIWKSHADNKYASTGSLSGIGTSASLTSTFITLATTQTPIGAKTWSGTQIWDIGTSTTASPKYQIQMSSNPVNGGIIGMIAGYQGNNKMLFNFMNSDMLFNGGITSSSTAMLSNPKIPTSSSKYISGNPANNDYVWKKWVQDNFTPLAGGYNSYTIIIDPTAPVVLGKQYPTINGAITDVTASLSITERYTLLVKQPDESVYTEDIEVPDWLNIIGEGQIKIFGQLTRTGASPDISSKLQNLYFVNNIAAAHDVDRFHVTNCVFDVNGTVVITDSICNGSGFYGSSITSGNGNRIMNCFGNQAVAWQSSDRIYSYNYIVDDFYSY